MLSIVRLFIHNFINERNESDVYLCGFVVSPTLSGAEYCSIFLL
jgi:hypothetical protein